jgi:2-C-methyl-D-erythritol 4-phosphate cytidylyltransferase
MTRTESSEREDRLIALVPAAGIGARALRAEDAQVPKQYRLLAGKAMLRHTILALLADARIEQVRVAVAPDDDQAAEALQGLSRVVCVPCGGQTRAQTVYNALCDAELAAHDWALVHDAARPGLPAEALGRLIDACLPNGVGGLLALPVPDTVKRARTSATAPAGIAAVETTLERDRLWLAQTPQMFRAGLLRSALEQVLAGAARTDHVPTDEAQAMEAAGYAPLLVPGSGRNTKITWPDDFEWVESWL